MDLAAQLPPINKTNPEILEIIEIIENIFEIIDKFSEYIFSRICVEFAELHICSERHSQKN